MAEGASPDANTDVLAVRISADGICHFLDESAPCEQLGKYLLTKHLAPNRLLHFTADQASKYELVAATVKSLQGTGFKVGFVNSEPLTEATISIGNNIGYATVADALANLKAQGFMALPGINGDLSFAEPDNETTWTFVGKDHPAYPSAARHVFTKSGGVPHVEIAFLCEASDAACEKLRRDVLVNVSLMSKMTAGDPSVKCWVNNDTTKCGVEPIRKQTNQQIYVQVGNDGSCSIDALATPCQDVAKRIRAEHRSDDPNVAVCASANIKYDAIGNVLGLLTDEHLLAAFGCPPR